jgi:AraC-like DNA-binding protein
VEQLAREIGMSRSQIHRKMVALTNQSPNQFIRVFRLNRAKDLILKQVATTSEIAYQVGFSSPSYFTKCFREEFGHTPSEIPG